MHNYKKKLLTMNFERGKMYDVEIVHDDWCGVFKDKECDCDPDIIVKEIKCEKP